MAGARGAPAHSPFQSPLTNLGGLEQVSAVTAKGHPPQPFVPVGMILLMVACSGDTTPSRGAVVVDSTVPIEMLLERFRQGLEEPTSVEGWSASRDALIRALVDAIERSDSSAFRTLALSRAEFAWIYYPRIPEAAPPYELDPGLMWFMIQTRSTRGVRALLEERGGRPLGFVDYSCDGERHHDGLTIWAPCLVRRVHAPGDTVAESLFGPVVSWNGRFKFVSYANRL